MDYDGDNQKISENDMVLVPDVGKIAKVIEIKEDDIRIRFFDGIEISVSEENILKIAEENNE